MSGQSVVSAGSGQSTVTQTNTIRNSFRQPYLGWRSQEKLSQPRTPAERYVELNLELLNQIFN